MRRVEIVIPDDPFKHPEVKFEGFWRGPDVNVAITAMKRAYRTYKGGEMNGRPTTESGTGTVAGTRAGSGAGTGKSRV